MRTASCDTGLITIDGINVGINLGYDFCAEHEWGTKRMSAGLGLTDGPFDNFDQTIIPANNPNIHYYECDNYNSVGFIPYFYKGGYKEAVEYFVGKNPKDYKYTAEHAEKRHDGFYAQWDEREFMLVGFTDKAKAKVKKLYEKMIEGKVAKLRAKAVFGGGGLCFVFVDSYQEKYKKAFNDACDDLKKLKAASEATGILERLEKAGKRYYACSPRWKNGKSGGEVVYWLNPQEQHLYNSMWCSVADLDAWIEGKGPIPKGNKQNA